MNRKQLNQHTELAIKWRQFKSVKDCQSGFTIIESLIALVVVAILMSAIAPVIVLSVATRVQSKRVESGTQAARAYLDGVRAGSIDAPKQFKQLTEVNSSKGFTSQRDIFSQVAAPNATLPTCTSPTRGYCSDTATSSLYCIDLDGGGCTNTSNKDFIIQAFRSSPNATADEPDKGYLLGVRVYRAGGFKGTGTTLKTQQGGSKSSTCTSGLGDRQAPVFETATEIASKGTKYQDYCDRFGGCQQ
jgi:prepilin-type N-terminal cleavage/methylation domain-containing protein